MTQNNNVTTQHMLSCPNCHHEVLSFITEYHKAHTARAWRKVVTFLLGFFLVLLFASSLGEIGNVIAQAFNGFLGSNLVDAETGAVTVPLTLVPAIITLWIVRGIIGIYISRTESKTHVQAICRTCGNIWLLN